MVKVEYSPLVSDVSGRFGGVVFSRWQGVNVVKKYAPAGNPNSDLQNRRRRAFHYIAGQWPATKGSPRSREPWIRRAASRRGSAYTVFQSRNLDAIYESGDVSQFEWFPWPDPGIEPAISLSLFTNLPGALTFTVATGTPDRVPGGVVNRLQLVVAHGIDWVDDDPLFETRITEDTWPGSDTTVTYNRTGLPHGAEVRVWVGITGFVVGRSGPEGIIGSPTITKNIKLAG